MPPFIEVHVPSQEIERSCVGLSILILSTIFRLDFGTTAVFLERHKVKVPNPQLEYTPFRVERYFSCTN